MSPAPQDSSLDANAQEDTPHQPSDNVSLTRTVSWLDNPAHPAEQRSLKDTNTNNTSTMTPNEATPIVRNNSDSRRSYQSTDSLPRASNQAEGPRSDEEGSEQPSQHQLRQRRSKSSSRNEHEQGGDNDEEPRQPWLRRVVDKYGALELDNKGSVARDHLALERTFLAWLRTSLAFASIGIAVTQLFRLNSSITSGTTGSTTSSVNSPNVLTPPIDQSSSSLLEILLAPPSSSGAGGARLRNVGKPLGATFIAIAILILLIGFHRYFEAQYWIVRGKFPASRGSVAVVTFLAAGLIVSSLVVILAIAPTALER